MTRLVFSILLTAASLAGFADGVRAAEVPRLERTGTACGATPCGRDLARQALAPAYGRSASRTTRFRDPEDGSFDTSEWLARSTGFLPVPILVTEPAVGFGGGLALAFFHGPLRRLQHPDGTEGRAIPPSVSIAGGAATENGTWMAFAGHLGVWNDDRIRYTGAGGYASVNLDFYGIASELLGRPLSLNIAGAFLLQGVEFRLRESNWWVGGRYVFFSSDVGVERRRPGVILPRRELDSQIGGLGVSLTYDSRDNIFTPNDGIKAQAQLTFFEPAFGSDFAYQDLHVFGLAWKQIHPRWNVGLRLDGQFAEGDVPFYALPFVQMRGVPAMRYQGNQVGTIETEVRYDLTQRWSLDVFGGLARATRSASRLFELKDISAESDSAWSVGAGFRYLVARELGLRVGVDVARGPEDWAFYLILGSSWFRP